MPLSSIGVIFHKLLNEIKEKQKKLLMEIDLEKNVNTPNTLFDKPDNLTPEFYFGDIQWNDFKQYEKTLLKIIFGNTKLWEMYYIITLKHTGAKPACLL